MRDLLVSAVPVELPGAPAAWISTQLDITDRNSVNAERTRLLESQIESRAVAEAALHRLRAIHTITDVALSYLNVDDLLRELLKRRMSSKNYKHWPFQDGHRPMVLRWTGRGRTGRSHETTYNPKILPSHQAA